MKQVKQLFSAETEIIAKGCWIFAAEPLFQKKNGLAPGRKTKRIRQKSLRYAYGCYRISRVKGCRVKSVITLLCFCFICLRPAGKKLIKKQGENGMSKGHDAKKNAKKEPTKTLKEKRAEKKAKKSTK